MLIQKPKDLYEHVLHKKEDRIQYIVNHIEYFYGEYYKYKRDKAGNKRLNKEKYVKQFGIYWRRPINPPNDELKDLQKKINGFLVNNIEFPDFIFGGVKNKDNIKNAYQHKGRKYVFQTDLKDFFPFITSKMVYNTLVEKGFSPDVASVITKLTTFKGHLPQGAPTSTTLANLVFLPTGLKLNEIAKQHNLRFTIFVDDVTFSSHNDFKHLTGNIISIIYKDGFKISRGKTTYKSNTSGKVEITGVAKYNNTLGITAKLRKKLSDTSQMKPESISGLISYAKRIRKFSNLSKKAKRNH